VSPVTGRTADVRLDALLRCTCEVIARRGLANTRTADIAAAAGVSQALVYYHFASKDKLLARAFAYAAERELARVDAIVTSTGAALRKIRRMLRLYRAGTGTPAGVWTVWIDGWAESMRVPELERVSRRLDLRWREALADVIEAGVAAGEFRCPDPYGAAWRIAALADGLTVQATVHERILSRRQLGDWLRLAAARELAVEPDRLA
jgi:AcrR family transcriptional regulator